MLDFKLSTVLLSPFVLEVHSLRRGVSRLRVLQGCHGLTRVWGLGFELRV